MPFARANQLLGREARAAETAAEVERLAAEAHFEGRYTERTRLKGKAEGIALAQDYLRAY